MKISFPNLALFQRSIMLDNRHWQSYIYRFVMLAIILYSLFKFFATNITRNAAGLDFLSAIAYINIVFITFLGISMFTSAITEEKEVDSLGLLLMTGINPISMLVSKGTGKLVMGLMLIISQFPFVLLSITMGGVSLTQIVSVYVTILVYMVLINNLALFCSVVFKRTASAAGVCFFVLITFNILVAIWDMTRWLSPFERIYKILQTASKEPIWGHQNSVYMTASLLFFALSYIFFNSCCRNTGPSAVPRLPGNARKAKWNIFRVKRTWRNALAWKTFYFSVGGKYSITLIHFVLLLVIIGFTMLFAFFNRSYYDNLDAKQVGGIILTTGFIALFVEGIYISDALFHGEVWNQTLSTLLTIPQSLKRIAYKKIFGGLIITIPTFLVIFVGLILIFEDFIQEIDEFGFWGFNLALILCVFFYYHLVAYFSLVMRYGGFIIAGLLFGVAVFCVAISIGLLNEISGHWMNGEVIMVLIILLAIPLNALMHFFIGMKIKSIAAKG